MAACMRFALVLMLTLIVCLAGCGGGGDSGRPVVTSTSPDNLATDVPTNTVVAATFSEEIAPATIVSPQTTFTLTHGGIDVPGTVTTSGTNAVFVPDANLLANTEYVAKITTGVRDLDGNRLRVEKVWRFTTGAGPANQTAVNLATAADFAVLGGTSVSNIGNTVVTGEVGVSPGTISGFPPGVATVVHANNDAASIQAQTDLTAAYNATAALTTDQIALNPELGGLTLRPGLYRSSSSMSITDANLTLNGGATDVFIFQIPTSLTVGDGRQVLLTGGAVASNVFWQVGDTVTVGTGSTMVGSIMVNNSITVGNAATLNGRALARSGSVTLDTDAITAP